MNGYTCSYREAGPRSAVGRAPDSQVRGPGFDTQSGYILSFLLPLIQEGQLSVTGESMCTKYWFIALIGGLSLPRKSVVKLKDCPDIILDVYRGRKTIQPTNTYREDKPTFLPPFSVGGQLLKERIFSSRSNFFFLYE